MSGLRGRLRSSGRLVALYRGLRGLVLGPPPSPVPRTPRPAAAEPSVEGVLELRRVSPIRSPFDGYRLNLLVPTVAPAGTFGGIRTALDLFEAVGDDAPARRIVSLAPLDQAGAATVPDYAWTPPGEDSEGPAQVVSVGSARSGSLAVGPRDVFVATFWTTAELVARMRGWQAATFGSTPAQWVYVIQDHEPGFYPSSAQSELARATYDDRSSTVALFNTELLRGAFHDAGIRFAHEFAFEPRIPGPLRDALASVPGPRTRTIVVYGRPRTPRNAFPAIVDGLRAWRRSDPASERWTVVSAGQPHPDVDLGGGLGMEALGKLDLPAYAGLLRTSAIGISLMVSPHPSYPPLEMAHLGLLVATNRYGAKDLSSWHSNVHSLDGLAAEQIAALLTELCARFEADPTAGDRGETHRPDYLSDDPVFPFAAQVAALLRAGVTAVPDPAGPPDPLS
jgi:O-antigen biosynthesis protein